MIARLLFMIVLIHFSLLVYGEAQEENPLFVEASNLIDQIKFADLQESVVQYWANRYADLQTTQQHLWQVAGQVDDGRCQDSCIELYNSQVIRWQNELERFNSEARRLLVNLKLSPEDQAICLRKCDEKQVKCGVRCGDVPIEDYQACQADCTDAKTQCVWRCSGWEAMPR